MQAARRVQVARGKTNKMKVNSVEGGHSCFAVRTGDPLPPLSLPVTVYRFGFTPIRNVSIITKSRTRSPREGSSSGWGPCRRRLG